MTNYVLFFINLESRRVDIAGITVHPDEPWMKQIAGKATMEGWSALRDCRYPLLLIGERSLRLALSEYVAHYPR